MMRRYHSDYPDRIALAEYKKKRRSKNPVDEASFFAGWRAGCEFEDSLHDPPPPAPEVRYHVACDCGWSFESKSMVDIAAQRGKHQMLGAEHKTETTC